jgi:Tfp pilus assembly protein PilO
MAFNLAPQTSSKNSLGSLVEFKKKSAQFSLTEVGFLVILIGLFTWFMVLPKWDSYKIKKDTLAKLNDDLSKVDGQITDLQNSLKVLENNSQNFSRLDEAFPLRTNPTTLQILFEEMTRNSDVTTRNLSISDGQERTYAANKDLLENPYKVSRVLRKFSGSIDVSGEFAKLQSFLKKIEHTNRLIKVSSMEIQREQGNTLLMKLNFEAYSYE